MISICDRCGKDLDKPGALVFGPPGLLGPGACEKIHVCFECWPIVRSIARPRIIAGVGRTSELTQSALLPESSR